jgi:hypothetical protein
MQFWYNRYTIPGWVLIGGLIILSRFLPVCMAQKTTLQELILQGQWDTGLALIGLFAGAPLGYLIYAIVEFLYRRVFGGTGQFVDHKRLRSGLLQICDRILDDEGTAESAAALFRIRGILKNATAFTDRAIYILIWQSHAAEDFRTGCHRRWESAHVSWGIICALVLAVVVSFTCACRACLLQDYLRQNAIALSIVLSAILLLYHNSILLAKQAGRQENLWIELFLTKVEDRPEAFFETLHL